MNLIRNEPAAVAGAVQTLLALAITFGLRLTAEQVGAIMAALAAALALFVRSESVSVVKYNGDHKPAPPIGGGQAP